VRAFRIRRALLRQRAQSEPGAALAGGGLTLGRGGRAFNLWFHEQPQAQGVRAAWGRPPIVSEQEPPNLVRKFENLVCSAPWRCCKVAIGATPGKCSAQDGGQGLRRHRLRGAVLADPGRAGGVGEARALRIMNGDADLLQPPHQTPYASPCIPIIYLFNVGLIGLYHDCPVLCCALRGWEVARSTLHLINICSFRAKPCQKTAWA
jgi:hypothetical protein